MKKLSLYVFLVFMLCNNTLAAEAVTKEDNVSLFGIILGDNLKNYKLGHCFNMRESDAGYDLEICDIEPKIKNKTFDMTGIQVQYFPVSKEIYEISGSTLENFKDRETCSKQPVHTGRRHSCMCETNRNEEQNEPGR